jgi:hypothetical protein
MPHENISINYGNGPKVLTESFTNAQYPRSRSFTTYNNHQRLEKAPGIISKPRQQDATRETLNLQ